MLFSLCLLLATGPALGEIFKYRDRLGNIHFTDHPKRGSGGFTLLWRSSRDPRYADYSHIDPGSMDDNRRRFTPLIAETARRTGLHPQLLHAVVRAESAYDPRALSRAGAQGLMQLIPATAERYGVADSWNPRENLDGGARYLRDLMIMFDHDMVLALAAYNAGENAVIKYDYSVPPYPETQNYVRKVIDFYQQGRQQARAVTASR